MHQTDESNYSCIIGVTDNSNTFLDTIKNGIQKMDTIGGYECIHVDDLGKINNKCGYFLIHHNDHKYELTYQYNKIDPGYIYNSVLFCTKTIFMWTLLNNEYGTNSSVTTNPINETKTLDINKINTNSHIALVGKHRTGKSSIILDIVNKLHNRDNFEKILIISPTDSSTNYYNNNLATKEYYNRVEIIHKLDYTALDKLIDYKRRNYNRNNVLLIMDDCLASKGEWSNNKTIQILFYNSKPMGITMITTMQYPIGIAPELRANFDYIFMFSEDCGSNKKRLYYHYADKYPTFEEFDKVFNELTNNYGSMIISNVEPRIPINVNDVTYKYSATI